MPFALAMRPLNLENMLHISILHMISEASRQRYFGAVWGRGRFSQLDRKLPGIPVPANSCEDRPYTILQRLTRLANEGVPDSGQYS